MSKLVNDDAVIKTREEEAKRIMNNHIMGALAAGLIPFPVVDVAALVGLQMNMLYRFSKVYHVEFSSQLAKTSVGSLVGGIVAESVGRGSVASLIKTIPVVGTVAGIMTMPVVSAASTYAVGKVFIQHFESGGTFLDFDPEGVRDYFYEQYEQGKKVVGDIKDTVKETVTGKETSVEPEKKASPKRGVSQ
jgi:uncharacterized protein (DUF697 family)